MIAFITGASAGFGKAIAEKFAANGWDVIITGRRKVRVDVLARQLKEKYNVNTLALSFDVRNNDEVKKAVASLEGNWKNIDLLVNNAGLAAGLGPIQEGSLDD